MCWEIFVLCHFQAYESQEDTSSSNMAHGGVLAELSYERWRGEF